MMPLNPTVGIGAIGLPGVIGGGHGLINNTFYFVGSQMSLQSLI
jgi:hypothetical protein